MNAPNALKSTYFVKPSHLNEQNKPRGFGVPENQANLVIKGVMNVVMNVIMKVVMTVLMLVWLGGCRVLDMVKV